MVHASGLQGNALIHLQWGLQPLSWVFSLPSLLLLELQLPFIALQKSKTRAKTSSNITVWNQFCWLNNQNQKQLRVLKKIKTNNKSFDNGFSLLFIISFFLLLFIILLNHWNQFNNFSIVKHQSCKHVWCVVLNGVFEWLLQNDHKYHNILTPSSSLTLPSTHILSDAQMTAPHTQGMCRCVYGTDTQQPLKTTPSNHQHPTPLLSTLTKHSLPYSNFITVPILFGDSVHKMLSSSSLTEAKERRIPWKIQNSFWWLHIQDKWLTHSPIEETTQGGTTL